MRTIPRRAIGLALAACLMAPPLVAMASEQTPVTPRRHALDHSGQVRWGKASYYNLAGRTMADGTPMDPTACIAASKTLPLGTAARVTNLRNGKSTVVEIRDRGPYVKGRIVDLSPKAAHDIGMRHDGVAPVAVAPIAVPQPDGSVKMGAGAAAVDTALE